MFLLAVLLVFPLASAAATEEPKEVVRQTADQMLGKLRSHRAELDADPNLIYGMVQEIVLPRFDFELISRYVLGRYWRQASAAQQQAFIEGFRSLLVRTYAWLVLLQRRGLINEWGIGMGLWEEPLPLVWAVLLEVESTWDVPSAVPMVSDWVVVLLQEEPDVLAVPQDSLSVWDLPHASPCTSPSVWAQRQHTISMVRAFVRAIKACL